MCKVWAVIIIIIALIVAVLASVWPQDRLADIIYITRFFDVMLPILAAGALIKYLFCHHGYGKCGHAHGHPHHEHDVTHTHEVKYDRERPERL